MDQHSWWKTNRVNRPVHLLYYSDTYLHHRCWLRDLNQLKSETPVLSTSVGRKNFEKSCRSSRYTLWKARRVLFCHTFLTELEDKNKSWFSKSTTTWTDWRNFCFKETIMRIQFFNNAIIFFQCNRFFSNNSACDFTLSGEPRIISPSFIGVLISWQIFRKDFNGLFLSPSFFSASTFKTALWSSPNLSSSRYHKFIIDSKVTIRSWMESKNKTGDSAWTFQRPF